MSLEGDAHKGHRLGLRELDVASNHVLGGGKWDPPAASKGGPFVPKMAHARVLQVQMDRPWRTVGQQPVHASVFEPRLTSLFGEPIPIQSGLSGSVLASGLPDIHRHHSRSLFLSQG